MVWNARNSGHRQTWTHENPDNWSFKRFEHTTSRLEHQLGYWLYRFHFLCEKLVKLLSINLDSHCNSKCEFFLQFATLCNSQELKFRGSRNNGYWGQGGGASRKRSEHWCFASFVWNHIWSYVWSVGRLPFKIFLRKFGPDCNNLGMSFICWCSYLAHKRT